jgi:hypothetical protein
MGAEVFEEVVMPVHAVQRGVRRMGLMKVPEQIVDKVGERFGNHG